MTINGSLKATLAADYAADDAAGFVAACSGDPGSGTLANEITGGDYARAAITWTDNGDGTATGTGQLSIPASQAVDHLALVPDASGTTTVGDSCAVTWTTNSAAATATVSLTLTIT